MCVCDSVCVVRDREMERLCLCVFDSVCVE